jgi:methylglutamate dehydrogenase subunit D
MLKERPDLRSPIAGQQIVPQMESLRISEGAPGSIIQVAGWSDFTTAIEPLMTALGFNGCGDYGRVHAAEDIMCYRVAPDRLLLHSADPNLIAKTLEVISPSAGVVLDLSHARWLLRVEGTNAANFMSRMAPLDFDLVSFPDGAFAQTGIHHVSVLIYRRGDESFDILVPTTWARSIWLLMTESARPFN